jgi:hypothetical protein
VYRALLAQFVCSTILHIFQAFVEDPNGIELQKARFLLEKKKAKNFITTFTLMRIPKDFLFMSNLSLIKHL